MTADVLEISGMVDGGGVQHGYDTCKGIPARHQVPDVGRVVPGRSGRAVSLKGLLELSPPLAGARYLNVCSSDASFAISVPLEEVGEALIVYDDGQGPLSVAQGGPFRLLVPGHPDECVNVKRVAVLELAAEPGRDTRPEDDDEHRALHERRRQKRGG